MLLSQTLIEISITQVLITRSAVTRGPMQFQQFTDDMKKIGTGNLEEGMMRGISLLSFTRPLRNRGKALPW